ncbi:MAG: SHOCT domain-containing protein [Chloroflexota bacterium]
MGAGAKGSGADSATSALARLAELHDTGALTDEELEARKQELLDRL